jgi:epoxyqueuosine reductase
MDKHTLTLFIKSEVLALGFSACGIAKADFVEKDASYLRNWLEEGKEAGMSYMKNHFEKRTDPRLLVEGAKSVIVVLLNYYPGKVQNPELPQIAKYAYGKDYHIYIKNNLNKLLENIQKVVPDVQARVFTDSAPVLEKSWAVQAGLGRIGKNSMFIHPKIGSFCFIGEIILNLELEYDTPLSHHCGNCNKCIQACPTGALTAPYELDARKCLSYHTIENKEAIPEHIKPKLSNRLFGCDICQDICPSNKHIRPNSCTEMIPAEGLIEMNAEDWLRLTDEEFKKKFKESALLRAGLKKIQDTINCLQKTS